MEERETVLPTLPPTLWRTEDELEELSRSHQLPSDILQVREVEPEEEGSHGPGGDIGVFTPYPLAKGSCIFGPFKVREVKVNNSTKGEGQKEERSEDQEEDETREEQLEDNVLEFTSEGREKLAVSIQTEGRWLKLIRPGRRPEESNVTVCLQGSSLVWCEISQDIKEEHELIATCRREPEPPSPPSPQGEPPSQAPPTAPPARSPSDTGTPPTTTPGTPRPTGHTPPVSVKTEDGASPSPASMVVKSVLRPTTPNLVRPTPESSPLVLDRKASPDHGTSPQPARFPLIYGCVHCGVKFSNPRTLAAHVEFYCSKKSLPVDSTVDNNSADGMDVDRLKSDELGSYGKQRAGGIDSHLALAQMKREQLSPASSRRSDGDRSATSTPKEKHLRRPSSGDDSPDAPPSKTPKTGLSFQCPFCSYSSDKKISLNRHLRMHNTSTDESNSRSQTTSPDMEMEYSSADNFCRECNIQFSSRKTYMGHKEFYCATRRGSGNPDEGSLPPPPTATSAAAAAAAAVSQAEVELHQQMASFLPTQAAAYAVQSFLRSPGASQTMNSFLGQQPTIVVAAPMVAPSAMGNISTPTVILQPVIAVPPNMQSPPRQSQVPHHPRSLTGSPGPAVAAIASSSSSSSATSGSASAALRGAENKSELPLDLSCKRESPVVSSRASPSEHERVPAHSPTGEAQERPKDASVEPQDLSVKREWRTPTSDRSPQTASPGALQREPSLGHRTPDRPPEGVTGIPPPTAELLAAQAQVISMMNQHAAATAAMMLAPPPNISKCMECNIVFYKHENFLIHKEHYCAGRRISKRERLLAKEMSPGAAAPPVSHHPGDAQGVRNGALTPTSEGRSPAHCPSLSPQHSNTSPALTPPVAAAPPPPPPPPPGLNKTDLPMMEQNFLQFYCIPCKIKFSSIDTLTAHQEFYCPYNKENHTAENGTARESHHHHQHHIQQQQHRTSPGNPEIEAVSSGSRPDSGSGSNSPDGHQEGGVHGCPHCGHTYPSYRLLKLHFCKAASAHMALLRCPYCEFITQSDNRLVEHIKSHAPTKAYRCTICGYRGNTVRGMRMHGKTHVDEGHPFTDDNMVEYEEPPLIPRRHRTAVADAANPVDMEAELIRLKNEPYKRRRSRKGYEKAENFSPLRRQAPHVCTTCNEAFSDTGRLRQHMRVHMQEATYACRSCDLVTNDKASLVRHVKRVHESSSATRASSMEDSTDDNHSESAEGFSRNTDSVESTGMAPMKKEVIDDRSDFRQGSPRAVAATASPEVDRPRSRGTTPPSGGFGDRTGSDVERTGSSPPREQLKPEPAHSPEQIVVKHEKMENDVNQNRCPSNKSCSESSLPSSPLPPALTPHTPHGDPELPKRTPSTSPTVRNQSASPERPTSREVASSRPTSRPNSPGVNGQTELSPSELLMQKKGDKTGLNYCKQCDITFVYMSSFMAHKRYYCNSHAGERECSGVS